MSAPALPPDLLANPRLDQWVRIAADGVVEVFVGKIEFGQGIGTALAQIAADELDVPLALLRLTAGNTAICPDQGVTAGSWSVEVGGMALRVACAEVRRLFARQAALRLGVEENAVCILDGKLFALPDGPAFTYADLAPGVDLSCSASGEAKSKDWRARRLCGTSVQRTDFGGKLFGAGYIQDMELSGMLHARVVRPPSYSARLIGFNTDAVRAMPGVECVVVDGRFIGICAQREEDAIAAAGAAHRIAIWEESADLPEEDERQAWLTAMPNETSVVDESSGGTDDAAQLIDVRYSRPFLAHASIGPSCALAQWGGEHLTVWSHTQGSFLLQRELAATFNLSRDQVTVIHRDGAGCYGHNGADDAALDAALLARACGRPVRVQWMRDDEFMWSPFGSAMVVRIAAGIDAGGRIAKWQHEVWSHTHVQRPGMSGGLCLLGAWHRNPPAPLPLPRDFPMPAGGGQRNAKPIYVLPSRKVAYHFVPQRTLRTSALRALGAFANVFAIECCMDELARLAGTDPIAFRLAHLNDARASEVIATVARASGWDTPKAAATREGALRGRGVGFARYKNSAAYCAIVIEIEVTDRIVLERVTTAIDAGEVINPDGLRNQIEGGVLQAASWSLKEAVHWDRTRVTTRSWSDYPILRFDEAPQELTIEIISRPELPPLGIGECVAGPTAAAIANALADAIGIRVRDLPLTPERLRAAIEAG
jgi:CO/xanthine dehydrogenase Mo-binding subunit